MENETFEEPEFNAVYRVTFRFGGCKEDNILVRADDIQHAVKRAIDYQNKYKAIKDWPITTVTMLSDSLI